MNFRIDNYMNQIASISIAIKDNLMKLDARINHLLTENKKLIKVNNQLEQKNATLQAEYTKVLHQVEKALNAISMTEESNKYGDSND